MVFIIEAATRNGYKIRLAIAMLSGNMRTLTGIFLQSQKKIPKSRNTVKTDDIKKIILSRIKEFHMNWRDCRCQPTKCNHPVERLQMQ
jgi:hypothetical protein